MISEASTQAENSIAMRDGIVVGINPTLGFVSVKYTDLDTNSQVWCPYGIAMRSTQLGLGFGVLAPISEGCAVLTCRVSNNFEYVVCILPERPTGSGKSFTNWLSDNKINIDRLPIDIDESAKRLDNLDDDLLKWGEILLRSAGVVNAPTIHEGETVARSDRAPADILLDYLGRILMDTSRQITLRIGGRDLQTNKITTPDMTISFGKIVDATGIEKLDSNGKKIKVEILRGTDSLVLNEDGEWVTKNSKATITQKATGDIKIINDKIIFQLNNDGTYSVDNGDCKIEADASIVKINNTALTVDK